MRRTIATIAAYEAGLALLKVSGLLDWLQGTVTGAACWLEDTLAKIGVNV